MSATLTYAPATGRRPLPSFTPSRHKEQLEALFESELPLTVNVDARPQLQAAYIASSEQDKEFWRALMNAVEKHGTITVYAEY